MSQQFGDPGRFASPVVEVSDAYRVKLRDNKPLIIKAAHPHEAIEKYKYACGIIATDNKFDVVAELDGGDALDLPTRPTNIPTLTGFTDAERNGKEKETNLGVYGV